MLLEKYNYSNHSLYSVILPTIYDHQWFDSTSCQQLLEVLAVTALKFKKQFYGLSSVKSLCLYSAFDVP